MSQPASDVLQKGNTIHNQLAQLCGIHPDQVDDTCSRNPKKMDEKSERGRRDSSRLLGIISRRRGAHKKLFRRHPDRNAQPIHSGSSPIIVYRAAGNESPSCSWIWSPMRAHELKRSQGPAPMPWTGIHAWLPLRRRPLTARNFLSGAWRALCDAGMRLIL